MPKAGKDQFPGGKFPQIEIYFSQNKKDQLPKKVALKSKKLKLNHTNFRLKIKKTRSDHTKKPDPSISYRLKVKNKTVRVLLEIGSSEDLLFMKKGSSKHISVVKRVVSQSWGTYNGTFITDKVGDIEISFVEYSASKKVRLQPDIVEYSPGDHTPMHNLIMESRLCTTWGSIGLQGKDNTNRQGPLTHEEHGQYATQI